MTLLSNTPITVRNSSAAIRPGAAIAFLVLAGVVFVPMAHSAPRAEQRFKDPQFGYAFTIPDGWTQKKSIPRPYVAFLGPVDQGFQTNLNVYSEPAANKTLAEYVKAARASFAKDKSARLQSDSRTTLAGMPAVQFQSTIKLPDQDPTIARQVVTVHAGRGYMVTLTAAPSALKRYLPTFKKVLSSFRWQR